MTGPALDEPLANYGFLSWLRRGVATQIGRREGDAVNEPRAVVSVHLGFNADANAVDVPLQLLGSGELGTFDIRSVVRTWPRAEVADAEANYFPLIELREADLPWRLTPASAAATGRLRPWIVLVVQRDEEAEFRSATSSGALPSIVVRDTASLPDLAASWAWAHVQVSNETGLTLARIRNLVNERSALVTSRLLCPRRLDPLTRYTAYLVPAFERGRLAGLRLPVPDAVDGLAQAWTQGQAGVTLPVLYSWRFHTAEDGDFEALVRRLVPRVLPPEVGIRPMDVSDPGGALRGVAANDAPLGLEGALKTVRTLTTPWPASATKQKFVDRLRDLLNAPAALLKGPVPELAVAPPLYGRWHAAQETLEPGARPVWFQELNQDPRMRVTSGLGTQVVQAKQRELMAGAWLQVEGIRALNEERRQAQVARGAALRLYARHFVTAADESMLALTTRLHAKVKGSPVTIAALLRQSPIPLGVLDTAWRRVARPRGTIGRRQGRSAAPTAEGLLDRLNRGELRPAAPPPTPPLLPTIGGVAREATPVPQPRPPPVVERWRVFALLLLLLVLLVVAVASFGVLGLLGLAVATAAAVAVIPGAVRAALWRAITGAAPSVPPIGTRALEALEKESFDPELVRSTPPRPDFQLREAPPLGTPLPAPSAPVTAERDADSPDARLFRVAAIELMSALGAPVPAATPMRSVEIPLLRAKLQTAVDPRVTIARALRERTTFGPGVIWEREDPLEEIMAYPEFPQPMYEALRDLGQDWLLPGLELIPGNTVALVLANQRMIESFMVGLNHEMSRELLWNEFPTDQRGSYFRQFWNVQGVAPPQDDPDKLRDIREIHAWIKRLALGRHSARPPMPSGEERLVLLVRGDLFRRYPNTEVYALKALAHPSGKRSLGAARVDYEFHGRLDPDVAFFGFPLTPSQAAGAEDATDASLDQGWFFVLQEQPAEPRFGLDVGESFGAPVTQWSDLSWRSLAANAGELAAITHVDLDRPLPDVRPLNTGGEPAWHADTGLGRVGAQGAHLATITLQQPMRIAIHGSDMLRGTG
jgi:hypothetical protein